MPFRRLRLCARLAPVVLLPGLIGACSPKLTEFAPSCPSVAIRGDAADISRFRPNSTGRDLTDMTLDGRIVGFRGGCERENANTVRTVLTVDMVLARGPATQGRVLEAPYFVAVMDGDRIVDKLVFPVRVTLGENQTQARVSGGEVTLMIPVSKEKSAAAYNVLIGFQLTPDELETNRRRGPR